MNFRRIDQDTVQCILSEEEMNEYGFQVEDFFSDQKRAREFLEHLIEQAQEEIGYEVKGGMVSMQVMKTPDNQLVVTFTDKDVSEGLQSMLQHLHQQLAGLVDPEMLEALHNEEESVLSSLDDDALPTIPDHLIKEEETPQNKKEMKEKLSAPRVYRFDGFHAVEQFIDAFSFEKKIPSALFYQEEEDAYYLLVKKGKQKAKEYQSLCSRLGEFAVLWSMKPFAEQFCQEHFQVVIAKQAMKKLKKIEMGIE